MIRNNSEQALSPVVILNRQKRRACAILERPQTLSSCPRSARSPPVAAIAGLDDHGRAPAARSCPPHTCIRACPHSLVMNPHKDLITHVPVQESYHMAMSSSKHNNRVAIEPRKGSFSRHPPVLLIPMIQLPVSTEIKGEDTTALGQPSSEEPQSLRTRPLIMSLAVFRHFFSYKPTFSLFLPLPDAKVNW